MFVLSGAVSGFDGRSISLTISTHPQRLRLNRASLDIEGNNLDTVLLEFFEYMLLRNLIYKITG